MRKSRLHLSGQCCQDLNVTEEDAGEGGGDKEQEGDERSFFLPSKKMSISRRESAK